eukprot:TRINITY_DN2104_c3_g1_i4.p2 TRINITY_DN2104_c3_g1~~TRINITY_DN2104_c3_g1_i4.p2  ORF type:complete len:534 (-),score=132.99 TRINITY_DN2104_c3_g1_i4:860-2461(-)
MGDAVYIESEGENDDFLSTREIGELQRLPILTGSVGTLFTTSGDPHNNTQDLTVLLDATIIEETDDDLKFETNSVVVTGLAASLSAPAAAGGGGEASSKHVLERNASFTSSWSVRDFYLPKSLSIEDEAHHVLKAARAVSNELQNKLPPVVDNELQITEENIELRKKTLRELIETEEAYVRRMTELDTHYLKHLTVRNAIKGAGQIMSDETIAEIFASVSMIKQLHEALLFRIRTPKVMYYLSNPDSGIAGDEIEAFMFQTVEAFVTQVSVEQAYSNYLSRFEQSSLMLQNELKKSKFLLFVKINELLIGRKLDACRSEPIQRIPRYLLLLATLQKTKFSPASQAKKFLEKAITAVNDFAIDLEMTLEIEKGRNRLKELEREMLGDKLPLDNGNRFCVRQGELLVHHLSANPSGNAIPYMVLMLSDILILCAAVSDAGGNKKPSSLANSQQLIYRPKKYYWLKALEIINQSEVSFDIKCTESNRIERLVCPSEQEKLDWIEDIRKFMYILSRLKNKKKTQKLSEPDRPWKIIQ